MLNTHYVQASEALTFQEAMELILRLRQRGLDVRYGPPPRGAVCTQEFIRAAQDELTAMGKWNYRPEEEIEA